MGFVVDADLAPSLLHGWFPPTRENWQTVLTVFQWVYPIIGSAQWAISWYGMGKTSVQSRLNLPGRIGWVTMEAPGFLVLLYLMKTLPALNGIDDLPWQNKALAGLFVIHYIYRALVFPAIAPSMSPLHVLVWALALSFQLANGVSLGGWLAAYGPVTEAAWAAQWAATPRFAVGFVLFYAGLLGNYAHDEMLREIRRAEQARQQRERSSGKHAGDSRGIRKHYQVPQHGLFRWVLYPHYLCEWVEWAGFWIAAGWGCGPARTFLVNEIVTMAPRAVRGRRWYVDTFGADKVGRRWAVVPGVV